jgi:hypothetical protein
MVRPPRCRTHAPDRAALHVLRRQVEAEGDVATAVTLARILSNIPLSRGGPTSVVIFDIHALQARSAFPLPPLTQISECSQQSESKATAAGPPQWSSLISMRCRRALLLCPFTIHTTWCQPGHLSPQ